MFIRKVTILFIACSLLLCGCGNLQPNDTEHVIPTETTSSDVVTNDVPTATEPIADAQTISPLLDTTMENLTDAILSISLDEGDAYVDDTGRMQMDLTLYTYDKYDMVDISKLKVGDIMVRHSGEVAITSIERNELGTILINGGLEHGGFNLTTDDCGLFYEIDGNNQHNWYEIGDATIRVSVDFKGADHADPTLGEVTLYPGDFLVGAVTNYNFTPYNTTVRVENGLLVEMHRVYTP